MPSTYITILGDMWDYIAYKTLGSEKYTDILIAANMEQKYVSVFQGGIHLLIPDIETPKPILSPWSR
ncbi:tail protein X [Selenomonadales bacterium OttesenSCG-928-I06]|nr:tail protein X [Selenomonadales bacterium OttesenSCG-928-I06]